MSVQHADFTIERRYGHAPERAFSGFADPALKGQWFANAGNWDDFFWEMDFRVGGTEVSSGGAPGGRFNEFRGRYHEIVENERIVYAYDLLHDHRLISVSLTTIQFAPDGDGCLVTFTEQGVFFGQPDGPAQREHGTGILLDMFGRALDGEPVR